MEKQQEISPISDSLAANENGLGIESLQNRLQRYGAGKTRALDMAKYITELYPSNSKDKLQRAKLREEQKILLRLRQCADYLLFKNYYRVDEVRLHAANFCRKHMLCPFCAMRRGAKYLQAYLNRLEVVKAENPRLRAFFVTVTIKNTESLEQGFTHLRNAMKRMMEQRRNAAKGLRSDIEFSKALGGVHSIEFKRGSGSGLWHPHAHMVWLCEQEPNQHQLSKEWLAITGDSYIVDVRECYGETLVDAFMEVFKYALKFSDLPLADNWEAYNVLKGKRLVDNFGLFRGIQVSETLTDEDLNDEPYLLMLYRFAKGVGYNFVGQGDDQDIFNLMQHN